MSADDHPTPLSQQAAEPVVEPPKSWTGRVEKLESADARHEAADARHDARLSALEGGFARVEQKVDALTALSGEIKGLLTSPKFRWIALALAAAAYTYAKAHGVKIPFLEDQ
jgi:hypothetical protein